MSKQELQEPESTSDRLLRIAREAGYEPTGVECPGFSRDWQVASALLVGPGANSYLWVRRGDGPAYMQGQETLRSLARATLRTVPPRKRKGRP